MDKNNEHSLNIIMQACYNMYCLLYEFCEYCQENHVIF